MKKRLKIIIPALASILPIGATIACGQSLDNNDNFKSFSYQGKNFDSRNSLIKWIKSNAIAEQVAANNRQFSIKGDQNKVIYTNKDDALIDIMKNHLEQVDIYLNKDSSLTNVIDPITGEIQEDNFLLQANSVAYTAFKINAQTQYEIIDENGDLQVVTGSKYIYAKDPSNIILKNDGTDESALKAEKQRLEDIWNQTRDKAALSFIQVHNAFMFNGKLYANKATLANDLNKMEDGAVANIFGDSIKNNSKQITIANGTSQIISGDVISEDDKLEAYIRNNLLKFAQKGFGSSENDFIRAINANQANIESLVSRKNNFMNFIEVDSNKDIPTYIVDMNKTNSKGEPSNGNFYGNYFTQTPLGTSGISKKTDSGELINWNKISNPKINDVKQDLSIQELKSIINYLLITKGYSNPLVFFANATIASEVKDARKNNSQAKTFTQFLESLIINDQSSKNANYLNMLVSFIQNLQNGTRYNFLDTLNASYSYLIDTMIKYGEDNADIIKVAQYFQSILESLDTLVYQMIYPFLAQDDSGYITSSLINKEVKLNYFASAMSFYDDTKKSKGIDFQRHPLSIYRHLIGDTQHLSQKMRSLMNLNNDEGFRNKMVFGLMRAAMGAQGLKLNAIRHNQQVYQKWLRGNKAIDFLDTSWTSLEQDMKDDAFSSFEFQGEKVLFSEKNKSKEYLSIWQHVSNAQKDLPSIFSLGEHKYSLSTIQANINNYLLASNDKFNNSKKLINENIRNIKEQVLDQGFNNIRTNIEDKIIRDLGEDPKTYNRDTTEFSDLVVAKKKDYSWKDFWSQDLARVLKQRYLSKDKQKQTPLILFGEDVNAVKNSQFIVTTSEYMHNLNVINNRIIAPLEDRLKNLATFVGTTAAKAAMSYSAISSSTSNLAKLSKSAAAKTQDVVKQVVKNTVNSKNFGDSFWNDDSYSAPVDIFNEYSGLQMAAINFLNKFKDKNYEWSLQDLGAGLGDLLELDELGFGGKIIQGALDISMSIITNVIPFISDIFGFINSFSSSETIYYSYNSKEQDISYTWDGVTKNSSWWGLNQSVKGNIKDLKFIELLQVIGGRNVSDSGIYYNGKFYLDTNEPKANFTKELIEYVQAINPQDHKGTFVANSGKFSSIPLAWKMSFMDDKDSQTSIVETSVDNLVKDH